MSDQFGAPAHHPVARSEAVDMMLGALPHLVGFRPARSLVLLCSSEAEPQTYRFIMRCDLPAGDDIPDVTAQLLTAMHQNRWTGTLVVVLDDRPASQSRHRDLIATFVAALLADGVRVVDAVWAPDADPGSIWHSYLMPDRTGRTRDMRFSPQAATRAFHGDPVYSSREELARILDPDPADQIERRTALLSARIRTTHDESVAHHEDRCRIVNNAIDAAQAQPYEIELTDDAVADLADALSYPDVRDCWITAALTDRAAAAERLWTRLVQAVPPPERAHPATLLAIHAYLRGSGAFASIALDAALNAEPDNRLAAMLRETLDSGTSPTQLRSLIQQVANATGDCQARR